jgi:hypothetical protein
VESGEWEIVDGVLVCVTPGVLATTICHPAWAPLGSFRSNFVLANPADGKVYKVRAGDPLDGAVEATWTLTETSPGGFDVTLEIEGSGNTKTVSGFAMGTENPVIGGLCYVPGVQATAFTALQGGLPDDIYEAEICIDDTGAARCFDGLGNFSFLEGDFDDWLYEIHWIDNRNCPYCECLCVEGFGYSAIVKCWPDTLTLTLTNGGDCPGIPASFTLNAKWETGGTNFDTPSIIDSAAKRVWLSDTITRDDFYYLWRLDCDYAYGDNYGAGYPKMRLAMVFWTDYGTSFPFSTLDPTGLGDYLGFDIAYDETLDFVTVGPNNSRTNAISLATSTCNPILLRFPPFKERQLIFSTQAFLCSETGYHDNTVGVDGELYEYNFSVEITE